MSLKQRLLNYLRKQEGFCNGGELERLAEQAGLKGSNASRRCRELCNEGFIERKIEKSEYSKIASVWYRASQPKKIISYSVPELDLKFEKRVY